MKQNSLLSIVIPTFNRAEFLDYCLGLQIPIAREYAIAIYITDNSSDDNTKLIVENRMSEYCHLKYIRNNENMGPDKNFELGLKLPKTDYIWLMGDTYHIPKKLIEFTIEKISKSNVVFDCFIFNAEGRVRNIPSQEYTDKNKLLLDLGWHMTCMSSLVYSKNLISNANFERYRDTSFIQTGIIFEYINNYKFNICWTDNLSALNIKIDGVGKNSWQSIVFYIWMERWTNFVFSLPASYHVTTKLKCIMDHGVKSGLFSIKRLILLRYENTLNYETYKTYKHLIPLTIKHATFTVLLISIIPMRITKLIISLSRLAKNGICRI